MQFIIAQDYGHHIKAFQDEMGRAAVAIHYREQVTDGAGESARGAD